jgi:Zn finger protein HypA/HybF involved in hydrogenase expression
MKYKRINNSTFIGDDNKTIKVIIDNVTYKSCAICDNFYPIKGHNTKYCPNCRAKVNIIKTSDRQKTNHTK